MSAPRLLDLFCGAGGCSVGFARAGFEVVGVDKEWHDDYPFAMHKGDAMVALGHLSKRGTIGFKRERMGFEWWYTLRDFDVIAASPPCPRYSEITPAANRDGHPDLIPVVRDILREWGGAYVIENVEGAKRHMVNPVTLCGSTFGLAVRRHRLFESNVPMLQPECEHAAQPQVWGVYGDHGDLAPVVRPNGTSRGNKARDVAHAREVMGIDWMTDWDDLTDAIPPAYTEHIGATLMEYLGHEDVRGSGLRPEVLREGSVPEALPGVAEVRAS